MAKERTILIVPAGAREAAGGVTCLVSSAATGDAYCVLELLLAPGEGPPLHVHRQEDEVCHVLAGECRVGNGQWDQVLASGATVVFPAGVPHFFRNDGEQPCRVLITAIPGGLDRYFSEIDQALAGNRPDAIDAINEKYGIEFFPSTPGDA